MSHFEHAPSASANAAMARSARLRASMVDFAVDIIVCGSPKRLPLRHASPTMEFNGALRPSCGAARQERERIGAGFPLCYPPGPATPLVPAKAGTQFFLEALAGFPLEFTPDGDRGRE